MADHHGSGQGLNQSQGLRDAERLLSGVLGYAIVATLVAVPVFTIILVLYLLAKFA